MKYLFIAKKFVHLKRGAWTASHDLADSFPQYITLKEDKEIDTIKGVVNGFDKVVFVTQVPHLYSFSVHFLSLYEIDHLIFIRSEHNMASYNSCTNGFYYHKEHPDIKNYIPFLPNVKAEEPKKECFGFYYRPYLNPDSCKWFIDNFKDNDHPVMTMGEMPIPMLKRDNWSHTYDRKKFWSNITTYIYPISTKYVDPFPTSIVEAIQTGKRVLTPSLGIRKYKDGIDDCIEVMKYDSSLFNFSLYESFYTNLFNTGMNNYINRYKYKCIIDYLLSIV
jgi:hypothetical protein